MKFELDRLTDYSDKALLAEVRRVAALIPTGPLPSSLFDEHGKVHSSTLRNRFGNWRKVLEAVGLGERFDDSTEAWTREEIIGALKSLAVERGDNFVPKRLLTERYGISDRPIRRMFGSYRHAVEAANLAQTPGGVRYSDDERFENMIAVWTALGRQPRYSEMTRPPSVIGPKAYVSRWGSWRAALKAFVEQVNRDSPTEVRSTSGEPDAQLATELVEAKQTPRGPSLGLRFHVLKRDRFRCVLCGRSPATHTITLHVDHVIPWSKDGATTADNLRSLCDECNLGRGNRHDV